MEEEAGAAKGKERRVTFRMEGGDYDALCERCERAGLSKSEYLRYLVRIPLSTEANAGDEHRILVDRRAFGRCRGSSRSGATTTTRPCTR